MRARFANDSRIPARPNDRFPRTRQVHGLSPANKARFVHNERDPRVNAIPDIHGHAKGEHKPYTEERPLPLTARMLFLWFYHACRRGFPRFMMVTDHMNYLTFEDPAAVNLVRRALKLAQAGDLYGAAETAGVDVGHAQVVSEGLRRGMRYSIGAEIDNDPRCRPDAQNIVDAMRPDGMIRSVHFLTIEHPVHGPNWSWPFDNPEFVSLFEHVGVEKTWELYMAVLLDAIERLPGQIVGHFYVPAVFGHWPPDAILEAYEDKMLAACAARGNMAIEFNTRFLYKEGRTDEERAKYLAVNTRLLRKARDLGIGIAIGSDAHSPRDQGGYFRTVLEILDRLEINEIVFPIGGRLLRVALRVVKPPEPEPVPVPEPVAAISEPKRPRKARPESTPTRPAEPVRAAAGRERKPRPEPPPAEAAPEAVAAEPRPRLARPAAPPAVAPKRPTVPPAAKAPPKPPPAAPVKAAAKPVASKKAPPVKVTAAKAPAAKAAAPAKAVPAVKAAPAKAAPAKAPAPIKAAAKPAPVKAALAKKAPPKKAAPPKKVAVDHKPPAKKAGPAKKAAVAKKAPPKATPAKKQPARPAAKRPAPAARPAAKKAAPVRKPVKKAPAKKAAPKRR
jgi:HisJ family histidinol phosphate phosphatase